MRNTKKNEEAEAIRAFASKTSDLLSLHYGASPLNDDRRASSVKSRNSLSYFLHKKGFSLLALGKAFMRDHSTISHGIRSFDDSLRIYRTFHMQYEEIEKQLALELARFEPLKRFISNERNGDDKSHASEK